MYIVLRHPLRGDRQHRQGQWAGLMQAAVAELTIADMVAIPAYAAARVP